MPPSKNQRKNSIKRKSGSFSIDEKKRKVSLKSKKNSLPVEKKNLNFQENIQKTDSYGGTESTETVISPMQDTTEDIEKSSETIFRPDVLSDMPVHEVSPEINITEKSSETIFRPDVSSDMPIKDVSIKINNPEKPSETLFKPYLSSNEPMLDEHVEINQIEKSYDAGSSLQLNKSKLPTENSVESAGSVENNLQMSKEQMLKSKIEDLENPATVFDKEQNSTMRGQEMKLNIETISKAIETTYKQKTVIDNQVNEKDQEPENASPNIEMKAKEIIPENSINIQRKSDDDHVVKRIKNSQKVEPSENMGEEIDLYQSQTNKDIKKESIETSFNNEALENDKESRSESLLCKKVKELQNSDNAESLDNNKSPFLQSPPLNPFSSITKIDVEIPKDLIPFANALENQNTDLHINNKTREGCLDSDTLTDTEKKIDIPAFLNGSSIMQNGSIKLNDLVEGSDKHTACDNYDNSSHLDAIKNNQSSNKLSCPFLSKIENCTNQDNTKDVTNIQNKILSKNDNQIIFIESASLFTFEEKKWYNAGPGVITISSFLGKTRLTFSRDDSGLSVIDFVLTPEFFCKLNKNAVIFAYESFIYSIRLRDETKAQNVHNLLVVDKNESLVNK